MSNVPKLRFKEFSGEWEKKKLGDITTKIGSGNTPLGGEKVYIEEGVLFIRSQNVINDKLELSDKTFIPSDIHNKMKGSKVFPNDVLLNITGASIGRSCVVPNNIIEANVNQHVCIVRGDNTLNSNFLQTFISSSKGQKLISQGQTGSGREGLNFQSIASFKLDLPDVKEQEKIASFLTSVDTKIEQLTKKEQLLQQYKKGVMQKIFNQEIRFKADDGSEFCEWEEKKLGQIGKFHAGGDLTKLNYSKEKSNEYVYPIYANGSGEGLYGYATTFQYKSNCVTVSGRGTLGHANLRKENFNAIVRLIVIEPKSNICGNFLKEAINRINFSIESTGVPQLTIPQISLYKVFLPCLEEQNKIAIFLSSIDTKIEQTQKQLELSKEFKKGLLQQMFI